MSSHLSLDVLLSKEVCRLLDSFAAIIKTQVIFYSAGGEILKRGRDCSVSSFCALVQQKYFSLETCQNLDREMQEHTRKTGKLCSYTCHAGLMEAVAPVKSGDKCIGFVVIGQFREANSLPPEHLSPEEKEAFFEQPQVSADELKARLGLFRSLVFYIASRELLLLSGVRKIDIINRYIDTHLTEKITLSDLARHIGSSVSGLTHYLREHFHTSSKSMLIEKRLEQAEKLLRSTPQMSIAEVAEKVGYDDCFYFSRLFRKHRGLPPRNCRAQQEEQN